MSDRGMPKTDVDEVGDSDLDDPPAVHEFIARGQVALVDLAPRGTTENGNSDGLGRLFDAA